MPSRFSISILFAFALTGFSAVRAQPLLQFNPGRASLGGTVDGSWRSSSGFIGRPFNQNNFRQWVVIPFHGALVNPGLANYSFSIKPNFTQQSSTDLPEALKSRNLGYAADASFLSSQILTFRLHWSRDNGLQRGGFGTQGEFDTDVFNPSVHLNTPILPIHASYTRRSSRNLTQVGPGLIPIEHSDAVRTFLIEARNSKLTAGYERSEFDDRLRDNDYSSKNTYLDHRFRWGKRSQLASRFNRTERSGTLPYMRQSWSEELRLQHTTSTFTEMEFSRYKSEGFGGASEGHTWGAGMTSRIGSNVDYGARISKNVSTFDNGRLDAFSGGPWVSWSASLNQDVRLSAGGSLSYLNRHLENEGDSFIRVINESYSVDETRIVTLQPLNVDPTNIIIQNSGETFFYEEGLDYELVSIGSSVEIHILPGSRITDGDVLLVSYQYRPDFDATDEGFFSNFDVGLRVAGVNLRHAQSHRATSVSGDGFIPTSGDYDQYSTTLSTFRETPLGHLDVQLSNRRRRSETQRYTTNEARLSLGLPPWKSFRIHLNTLARGVDEGGDKVRLYSAGMALSKTLIKDMRLHAGVNYQHWEQVERFTERSLNANASIDYQVGLVGLKLRYEYDQRITNFNAVGHRVSLYVLRRF